MRTIQDALINLLKVKSIVTIITTFVFAYQAVTGTISQDFLTVYLIIISFYFGTQLGKTKDSNESEVV